jgi:FKBP-type peptidyl-prolyl cis-trans isomerase SlyD
MLAGKDTVVSINYELTEVDGDLVERSSEPVSYLHGGYHGIFGPVEVALEGKSAGESCLVRLEPDDAFGHYDEELVRMEPRNVFPDNVAVGMRFEGQGADSGEMRLYTVTDIAGDKVMVDGNHPLAGRALNFSCTIVAVRAATQDEITHGHAHGEGGHHH